MKHRKDQLKKAKLNYKESLKNPIRHEQERNSFLEAFTKNRVPNWGSLTLIITKI